MNEIKQVITGNTMRKCDLMDGCMCVREKNQREGEREREREREREIKKIGYKLQTKSN